MYEGFIVDEVISQSSRSNIYRARRVDDQRPVILKVLNESHLRSSSEDRARYRHEFETTQRLDSPHIARHLAFRSDAVGTFLVLEDVGATSLDRWTKNRELSVEQVLRIAIHVSDALTVVHGADIVHNDIKPGNIVFSPDSRQATLIDFGASTVLVSAGAVQREVPGAEGTLAYVSPEQTGRMNRAIDYRSDLYSLGVTLYQLLVRRVPFDGEDALELVHAHLARRPQPPAEVNPKIPLSVSDIVMKLLEKSPEDRYQSASGLKADLEHCLELSPTLRTTRFALGKNDVPSTFFIPQKLYGRADAAARLRALFERTASGPFEVGLVSGASGIGKTALIEELYLPVSQRRGHFISGKFDQLQRNVPYSAIGQAFRALVQQLLCEPEQHLARRRGEILAVLGDKAGALFEVIPELARLTGPQPPVPELRPTETQNRFNLLFGKLLNVLCQPEHPLVIFIDDLQWIDSASLRLLEMFVAERDRRGLLLLGAYRHHEVGPGHPLSQLLDKMRDQKVAVEHIELGPLEREHIAEFCREVLHRPTNEVEPVVELLLQKTDGNPFFVGQFLRSLHADGLLTFDAKRRHFAWSLSAIQNRNVSENVADLLVRRLESFGSESHRTIHLAACIGNQFDLRTLAWIRDASEEATYAWLVPALTAGLVISTSNPETAESDPHPVLLHRHFRFLHDRVQQAAYDAEDAEARKLSHLRIGRCLLGCTSAVERRERIFEIVDHLNTAHDRVTEGERRVLGELNEVAGQRAKEANAYAAAGEYYGAAIACIGSWEDEHENNMRLRMALAEVEYLIGHFDVSERSGLALLERACTPVEQAEICLLLILQYSLQNRYGDVMRWGFVGLRALGIELEHVEWTFDTALADISRRVGGADVASLIDRPAMTDPGIRVAMRLLSALQPNAYISDQSLWALMSIKLVELSLEYGNCPESPSGYITFGTIMGRARSDYRAGYEYGLLGWRLNERSGNLTQKCKAGVNFGAFFSPWVEPIQASLTLLDEGYRAGLDAGELLWAGYNLTDKCLTLHFLGERLPQLKAQIEECLHFCRQTRNDPARTLAEALEFSVVNLMGETDNEATFTLGDVSAASFIEANASQKLQIVWLYIGMAQALYVHGDRAGALAWCTKAEELLPYGAGLVNNAVHAFLYALCLVGERAHMEAKLETYRAKLALWAETCPANFRALHLTLEADLAHSEGDSWRAVKLLTDAAAAARAHGFRYFEALACEKLGELFTQSGLVDAGTGYLVRARDRYKDWGAVRKVAILDRKYGQVLAGAARATPSTYPSTFGSSDSLGGAIDLTAIANASQAISSEVELELVFGTLLRICLAAAGAETAVLVTEKKDELLAVAHARVDEEPLVWQMPMADCPALIPAIVHYVARTNEPVVLQEAGRDPIFGRDEAIARRQVKSVLCLPVMRGGGLMGILYLENNQTTGAFTVARVRVLTMLAAQAAISLDNAQLYATLKENNERLEAALEAARESARIKTQFLANTSHELRTPLNAIVNIPDGLIERLSEHEAMECAACGGLVMHDEEPPAAHGRCPMCGAEDALSENRLCLYGGERDEAAKYLGVIRTNGEQLLGLVEDLLALARLEVDRLRVDPEQLDTGYVAREVVDTMRRLGEARGIKVELVAEERAPSILADHVRLRQVLTNLVDNAIKFSKDGATVTVEVREEDEHALFTIRDQGIGIAEHQLERIFESFYQVDSGTTRVAGGAGLGLAIARRIVEIHGGTIWVESTLGRGSTFFVRLPCAGPPISQSNVGGPNEVRP